MGLGQVFTGREPKVKVEKEREKGFQQENTYYIMIHPKDRKEQGTWISNVQHVIESFVKKQQKMHSRER